MRLIRQIGLAVWLAVLWLLPLQAATGQQEKLPRVEVKSLDGRALDSHQLASTSKWLLVYVQPHCGPCQDLLLTFKGLEAPSDLRQKVKIVIGGDEEQARLVAERFAWLPESSFHADSAGALARDLKLTGAPVIFGLQGENIEWSLAGVPADVRTLRSILTSWCAQRP